MFIDIAKIKIVSGKGGDGKVGFHREKYVASGGPDGGDGGRGGSVIFKVDDNLSTLLDFRYKKKYVAGAGENGGSKRCKGKDGADLIIRVPRGTIIRDQKTGQVIKDLSDDEPFIAAKGGNGGWGNTHFATRPVRRRVLPSPVSRALSATSFWSSSCSRTWVWSASRTWASPRF